MKLTGQKLKETRESARLTISEVSLATKINPKVLTAMEAGDAEHLPARTFLRGFVRAYAGFLKMNVAEVLELFTQELNEGLPKEAAPLAVPATAEVKAKSKATSSKVDVDGEGSGTFRMFIVGGILLLVVMIIGVRSIVQKYERERNVDTTSDLSAIKVTPLEDKEQKPAEKKADDATAVTAVPGEVSSTSQAIAPANVTAPTVTPPPASVVVTAPPTPVAPKAEPPPKPEPVKVEAPKPAEPPKVEAKAEAKVEPPKAQTKADKAKRHEIILEALDKVDISYKANGQSKKIAMAPGQVHTIVTEESISFDVSDGGALNITDNGHDKGPAGDLGHRKQVSVP
jgi:cytoskeleton protein RodZ